LDSFSLGLLKAQHGRCPLCDGLLLTADHEPQSPDEWTQWLTVTRKAVRRKAITAQQVPGCSDKPATLRLLHAHCHRRLSAAGDSEPGNAPASQLERF
jgi:RNA-directed DNA polymerase